MQKRVSPCVFVQRKPPAKWVVPKRLLPLSNPAAAEGSPVQGELSVDRLTEGLVVTNKNSKR